MLNGGQVKGFQAYKDGTRLIGVAEIKLPTLKFMSEKIGGADVLGEVELPLIGITESLECEVKFNSVISSLLSLVDVAGSLVEYRGSIATHDSATGAIAEKAVRIVTKSPPKEIDLGSLATNKLMDSNCKLELTYLKIEIDGAAALEIDKFNAIFTILGKDLLVDYRDNLGLTAATPNSSSSDRATLGELLNFVA